jgi:hypothetical protein
VLELIPNMALASLVLIHFFSEMDFVCEISLMAWIYRFLFPGSKKEWSEWVMG